jgi:hypothetical protein
MMGLTNNCNPIYSGEPLFKACRDKQLARLNLMLGWWLITVISAVWEA